MENKNNSVSEFDRVADVIETLTLSDWNRLHKAARSFLYGTAFSDVDELINETLLRVLDGKRKWRDDVPFITFISNAMRSVADGERNLSYKTEEVLAIDLPNNNPDSDSDPMVMFGNEALSPETIITNEIDGALADEDLKIIENHFKGNETVEWVLMGIEDGMSASEIIEMSGMSKTEYESARKSFLRGLDKLFPGRRIKR
ncbi:MAG: sigma-70 family RNA polymerase sigma factor [Methyloglobulus sp.]|nr:sigma-70 family RNA polymerase sigma factor [Methyloglobulus sp.]